VSQILKNQAPGPLDTIRAFVNTFEVETGRERLESPETLIDWLEGHGLRTGKRATREDLRKAVAVREALRALLLANAGEMVGREAIGTLNAAVRRAHLSLVFEADGSLRLAPQASGLDGAIGALLAIVAAAMSDGTWSRLKACRAESCQWAFYDHTRNRSGVWCDMAVCGNRAKVRAYRERQAPEGD
jgi:predicted RNA-binding Zn ribbon-like protein